MHYLLYLFIVISTFPGIVSAQNQDVSVWFEGTIGKYPIEMEITGISGQDGISGKYRYKSKNSWLTLAGERYACCLRLTESWNDTETGEFYLNREGDSLVGKWVHEGKWLEVKLRHRSGETEALSSESPLDHSASTSAKKTGTYYAGEDWINDYFFSDDQPVLEMGFNGGYAMIEELGPDSLRFRVQVICGPTYHFAYADGVAHRKGKEYIYETREYSGEEGEAEPCKITISFSERSVTLDANTSYECGFGARAYLSHTLTKVNDKVDFDSEDLPEELLHGN